MPIDYTKINIKLYIDKRKWFKFINAFTRVFERLSTQGLYIDEININLDYSDSQIFKFETYRSLKLLSTFEVKRLRIENWYVTLETFKILSQDILFWSWIFGKTLNTKNIKYRTNRNIKLEFWNWKYGECTDDTFTKREYK